MEGEETEDQKGESGSTGDTHALTARWAEGEQDWLLVLALDPPSGELRMLDSDSDGWTMLLVDSGASVHVCHETDFAEFPMMKSSSLTLTTASGKKVVSDHMRRVRFRMESGQTFVVHFRVAEVTRPILSVALLGIRGWEAVFGDGYGYIQKKQDGSRRAELIGRGGLYYLRGQVEREHKVMNLEAEMEGQGQGGDAGSEPAYVEEND